MSEPMISLKGLRKVYDGSTAAAVDHVDLDVAPGEFLCMIGPSGSGKSTTLRLVAGFERPTAGRIEINGRDVTRVPPHKRNVPMVWQLFVLFPHMNVRENIEYGLKRRRINRAERRERVDAICETLRIGHLLERWTTQLSGGEQQRVGLARALVLAPQALLLDEPLGSLDASIALSIQRQLKELQRELGTTFLYITHNQSEALAMGDRIAVMHNGRIEQLGGAHDITTAPSSQFVAEFVGQNNVLKGRLAEKDQSYGCVVSRVGAFRGRMAHDYAVNESVAYAVSADSITLVRADGNVETPKHTSTDLSSNTISGIVDGEEFRGKRSLVVVDVGGSRLRADVLSDGRPELGENVKLTWSCEDAVVLPVSA